MKAGVAEKDLHRALGGWIAVENGIDLFPDGPKHTAYGLIISLGPAIRAFCQNAVRFAPGWRRWSWLGR